ncbi:hypothetical protein [Paraburkholderia hospita]|uniref:hypothetical protein n=1 Tax=Paraburkholderia hospita TaxID=169430 RepID=UPI002108AC26|nr:hypothetical protein [Paraburkholderia hospita]
MKRVILEFERPVLKEVQVADQISRNEREGHEYQPRIPLCNEPDERKRLFCLHRSSHAHGPHPEVIY